MQLETHETSLVSSQQVPQLLADANGKLLVGQGPGVLALVDLRHNDGQNLKAMETANVRQMAAGFGETYLVYLRPKDCVPQNEQFDPVEIGAVVKHLVNECGATQICFVVNAIGTAHRITQQAVKAESGVSSTVTNNKLRVLLSVSWTGEADGMVIGDYRKVAPGEMIGMHGEPIKTAERQVEPSAA